MKIFDLECFHVLWLWLRSRGMQVAECRLLWSSLKFGTYVCLFVDSQMLMMMKILIRPSFQIECRCEERIAEEQKRCREAIARVERDRDAQMAALTDRLASAEAEASDLKQEVNNTFIN